MYPFPAKLAQRYNDVKPGKNGHITPVPSGHQVNAGLPLCVAYGKGI